MVPKALLGGVIGFILGGLVVSTAAWLDNPRAEKQVTTSEHSETSVDKLEGLTGDDFDKAFIEEMIMHHQGAIDMAKLVRVNAKHEEIKKLGDDIMAAQSKEIDMMQTWQGDWGYKTVPKSHDMSEM